MLKKIALVVSTLWVGGLWMTAISAYLLFHTLANRQLAGEIAGHLFTAISIIGIAGGAFLVLQRFHEFGSRAFKQGYFWTLVVMVLFVLAGHFGIQPLLAQMKAAALPNDVMNSVFASRFSTWHGIASFAYLIECLLGLALIFKIR